MRTTRIKSMDGWLQCCIAITGGIGCGKTTVGQILRGLGYSVWDADILSREAVARGCSGLDDLVAEFGMGILNANLELDRRIIAEVIFSCSKKKEIFENIIHPRIQCLLQAQLNQNPPSQRFWFYEIPLLFEKSLHEKVARVWVVHCPQFIQESRVLSRDSRSLDMIRKIIANQLPQSKKVEQADIVIETYASAKEILNQITVGIEAEELFFRK